MLMTTKHIK